MLPQFVSSDEKSGDATAQQSLCGVTLRNFIAHLGEWFTLLVLKMFFVGKVIKKTDFIINCRLLKSAKLII